MRLKELVGSGSKIGRFTFPFLIIGVILNIVNPSLFSVGGPSTLLRVISLIFLTFGIINWIWSAALILNKIPQKKLITTGPYYLVKHPLYVGWAFLVLPWIGFLLNTWLGLVLGIVVYIGYRMHVSEEEKKLSETFGTSWNQYCSKVKMPWL